MSDELPKDYERGEAVVAILRRGADFTRQLLEENRRLRQVLQSQEERSKKEDKKTNKDNLKANKKSAGALENISDGIEALNGKLTESGI